MEAYHGWRIDKNNLIEGPVSCSMLKAFEPNPYAWKVTPEKEPTQAMKTGSLFDAALTDPDLLSELLPMPTMEPATVIPFKDLRSKAAKLEKESYEAQGHRVLTQAQSEKEMEAYKEKHEEYEKQLNRLNDAAKAVRLHPVAGKILEGAEFQVGVIGEAGGIPAKCLIDILPNQDSDWSESLVDYKTISTGLDDDSIRHAIGKFKYHWQAAFYRSLFNQIHPDRVCEDFGFIFQDVNTLEVRVFTLDEDALQQGNRAIAHALTKFANCAHNGIKSQFLTEGKKLGLMPYHAMQEDEKISREEA